MNNNGNHHRGRVLAVDDETMNLQLIDAILGADGFEVDRAMDGVEALESLAAHPYDCVVLDIMMPRMDGFETCKRIRENRLTHFTPIVMLTALSEVAYKIRGLEAGADDFLNKPVSREELLLRVRTLVRIKNLRKEMDTSQTIIYSMIQALENKDSCTAGHSKRVAEKSMRLARALGLTSSSMEVIGKGAILHDIGKIGLPDDLMRPREGMDEKALALYRSHAEKGEQILAPFVSFSGTRALVRHHHERLDGSGFPDGLSGEEFSIETEIIAIANLYEQAHDAIGSVEEALETVKEEAVRGAFHRGVYELLAGIVRASLSREGSEGDWEDLLPLPQPNYTGRVLLAEGHEDEGEIITELLEGYGHTVLRVRDGREVLMRVGEMHPDLLLMRDDIEGVDGYTLCSRIKRDRKTQFLPVIMLTAGDSRNDRKRCIEVGAEDILRLPPNRDEFMARVRSLLRLRLYFRNLEEHQSVVMALASALEAKDPYTRGHSERVSALSVRLARELGCSDETIGTLEMGGLLHDLGKIAIPSRLLNKPGKLEENEYIAIMKHSEYGENICKPLRAVAKILPIIRHHHERFNGSGYPDHLRGEEISLETRILSVVDAYDALTSKRSYRSNLTPSEALELLQRETEQGLWDPHISNALVRLIQRDLQ